MLEKLMLLFLPKEKVVTAKITGCDYKRNKLSALVNGKVAEIAMEDISIYQNQKNTYQRLINSEVKCKVIGYKDKRYILSRKAYMQQRVDSIDKNDIVEGIVVSISNEALYLEFDEGLSGILYTNQLTNTPLNSLRDLYDIGDKITCQVIKKNGNLFTLSKLRLYSAKELSLAIGNVVKCKILKLLDENDGYFVELCENPTYCGIFDLNQYNIDNNYEVGQYIDLRITKINGKKLKLSTYLKNAQ